MSARNADPDAFNPDQHPQAAGCCSDYILAPLIILLVAAGLSVAAIRHPVNAATFGTAAAPAASAGAGDIAPIFTPEIRYWAGSLVAWSAAEELDPNLAATVMQIESCGDPRATSRSGAIGLFQVMPYHFASNPP